MPATVIVGLQWGDEGKGKTTDFLAEQVAMVVRYQGGDNAGHTVVRGDEVFKLRLTPSGVLYPHMTSVIGNGVVVNPVTLIDELDMLTERGIDVSRVRVSRSAHVIMPYHVALDQANEARLADAKVGTTGRGIGPTYGDRAWRLGLRMEGLLDRAVLLDRLERVLPEKNALLRAFGRNRTRCRRRVPEIAPDRTAGRRDARVTSYSHVKQRSLLRSRRALLRPGFSPRPGLCDRAIADASCIIDLMCSQHKYTKRGHKIGIGRRKPTPLARRTRAIAINGVPWSVTAGAEPVSSP